MSEQQAPRTVVEIEEDVYRHVPTDNEAGPLWCYGSTCLVRIQDDVFISGLESLPGVQRWNNVRWLLFQRETDDWTLQQRDPERTREPSPLAGFPDGRLFLSANPTLAPINTPGTCPAQPQVLRFSARDPTAPFQTLLPDWGENPYFTQHSYRGLGADATCQDLLLLNIFNHLGQECYYWSLMDSAEKWVAHGKLAFPWGADYEVPQIIRLCYPQIMLRGREVHILAISDIVEPVKAWKEARFEVTQRHWDYDFRRLFYTFTPDITTTPCVPWMQVASREQTAGHISNLDVWLAADGLVHALWNERSCDTRIRARFFPNEPLTVSLRHGVLRNGQLLATQILCQGGEGLGEELPIWGRFHIAADGRLYAFYAVGREERDAKGISGKTHDLENRIVALGPNATQGAYAAVALQQPFGRSFMTATPRGGSPLSSTLEVLGTGSDPNLYRYARIRVS